VDERTHCEIVPHANKDELRPWHDPPLNNLQPVNTKHEDVFERHDFNKFDIDQSAFAGMCIGRRTVFTMSKESVSLSGQMKS
jgi:hypothetical protein